jgi:hypothetical protein
MFINFDCLKYYVKRQFKDYKAKVGKMNRAVRDLQYKRIQERDPRVLVLSRPSRCVPIEAPVKREVAAEAAPQRKTAFSFVSVLLSKMGV